MAAKRAALGVVTPAAPAAQLDLVCVALVEHHCALVQRVLEVAVEHHSSDPMRVPRGVQRPDLGAVGEAQVVQGGLAQGGADGVEVPDDADRVGVGDERSGVALAAAPERTIVGDEPAKRRPGLREVADRPVEQGSRAANRIAEADAAGVIADQVIVVANAPGEDGAAEGLTGDQLGARAAGATGSNTRLPSRWAGSAAGSRSITTCVLPRAGCV